MSKIMKKILTVDDLIKFCQEQKFAKFSSKETGYQLAVKVPTTFEVDDNVDENHRGMMKLKFRIFHTGLNRNNSFVSKESATKAMNTIADRPVLAAIHQLDSGEWDFEGHEMEIITDENGNEELRYIESQVGSFSSEPAFWESENGKDYVCAYAYISREYTKACEIIERKQGTKNSCELFIDELAYNAKEKYLELIDFYVNASTLLGSRSDGTQIQEGMEGSRADIADFSVENNSIKFNKDEKLIELLETLNNTLSNFNKENIKEGGNETNMFEKLLEKYGKTVEDITFDYAELSDEELESKFADMFKEAETGTDGSGDEPSTDGEGDGTADPEADVNTDDNGEGSDDGNGDNSDDGEGNEQFEKLVRTFEISHEDVRYALYSLLGSFEEMDNEWYWISNVYDSYFVYENCEGTKIYRQDYSKDGDNVAFENERVELFKELLTASEKAELDAMRSNYAALKEFKENVEKNELTTKKNELINSEKYAVIAEKDEKGNYTNEAFAKLVSEMDNYSLAELETQIKVIHSDFMAENSNFSAKPESKMGAVKVFANPNKKAKPKKRYGNLFD